jgi:ribose/xylose/arabinose/galactoside ABC-type transport system permease subunit
MANLALNHAPKKNSLTNVLRQYGIYLALVLLIVVFSIASPRFATPSNFILILLQVAVTGIISIGMLFVILSAGIDLSVGAILALAGMISGVYANKAPTPLNIFLAIVFPIAVGLFCGLLNGSLVAWARVPALIVTLGTMYAIRGFVIWYRVNPIYDLQPWYRVIGQGSIGPVPLPVLIFFLVALAAWVVLTYTSFGRYVYAVGGNEQAARAAGINVSLVKLSVYTISGLLCGLAGLVFTSRLGAAQAISGQGFELIAIASVVVGGASLFGGRGTVEKTIIGALIIQVLSNGLVMLNVPSPIQQIIIGAIIIAAVGLDNFLRKNP